MKKQWEAHKSWLEWSHYPTITLARPFPPFFFLDTQNWVVVITDSMLPKPRICSRGCGSVVPWLRWKWNKLTHLPNQLLIFASYSLFSTVVSEIGNWLGYRLPCTDWSTSLELIMTYRCLVTISHLIGATATRLDLIIWKHYDTDGKISGCFLEEPVQYLVCKTGNLSNLYFAFLKKSRTNTLGLERKNRFYSAASSHWMKHFTYIFIIILRI